MPATKFSGRPDQRRKPPNFESAGVKPVIIDVFDGPALSLVMATVQPDIIMHQLTDLALGLDPKLMDEARIRNARIRSEGTRNLVAAALAGGARRIITQSIAWAYAPGPQPFSENDVLDLEAEGTRGITVRGVATLERLTTTSQPLGGIVLRYGQLYGPGTGNDTPGGSALLHVDAAAQAALLSIQRGEPGVYNIAEDTGFVSIAKARRGLGWDSSFRLEARKLAALP